MTTFIAQEHGNFEDLTLEEIQRELIELIELADQGYDIDEKRFDWLLQAQEANEDYQEMMEIERRHWRESIEDFVRECLERTRTFVPVNIFDCTHEDLVALGLSDELAKRLLQRQCLWLVRMGQDEISRLHESDLLGRFNCQQQHLDIIETAAVYASLPEEFRFDPAGRKKDWRAGIEDTLRQMLMENDQDILPIEKIRNPCYEGKQFGPVTDITSVRYVEIHKATDVRESRKSFIAICKEHSIMSRFNSINGRSRSTTMKSNTHPQRQSDDGTITPPPSRQERVDGEPDDGEGTLLPEEVEELAEEAEVHLRLSLANGEEMNLNVVRGEENEAEADTAAIEEEEETEIDALTESLAETAIQAEIEAEAEAEAEPEAEVEEEAENEEEAIDESCAEASEECQEKVPEEEETEGEQEQQQEKEEAREEVEEVAQITEDTDTDLVSNDAAVKDEEKEEEEGEEETTTVQPEEEEEAEKESAEEVEGEEQSEVKELRTEQEEEVADEESAPQSEEQEEQVVVEESEHTPDEESETY